MAAITNLAMRCVYPDAGSGYPVVMLMHGWSGDKNSFGDDALKRMAGKGLFICSAGMRGRNSAGGSRDASGREIYDIYDALQYVLANFAAKVDATKVAIVGYSGGGGNALAAACKFPDAWNVVVSHFGMSDYGRNNPDAWYYNAPANYPPEVATAVGDTPANVPDRYYARDATAAIANYSGGKLLLFHDQNDGSVPVVHSQRIAAAMDAAGLTNYEARITGVGDSPRWYHGYPALTDQPQLMQSEPIWIAAVKAQAAWTVPASGTVTVIGYLRTKRFEIRLGDLTDEAATVVYDTAADSYTVTPLTGGVSVVVIAQGAKTATQTISSETTIIVS